MLAEATHRGLIQSDAKGPPQQPTHEAPPLEIDVVGGTQGAAPTQSEMEQLRANSPGYQGRSVAGAGARGSEPGQVAPGQPNQANAANIAPDGWEYGVGRDLAFGGRSVLQGAGSLLGALGGDAFNHFLVDPVRNAFHTPSMSDLITGNSEVAPSSSYRDAAASLADRLGLPRA